MKTIFLAFCTLFIFSTVNAQEAYTGAGDNKLSVLANLQKNATGVCFAFDFGATQNISLGVTTSYASRIAKGVKTTFTDRFDIRARFNANLCNVFNVDNFDAYPGFSAGMKNIGAHVGFRYFLSDGFGLSMEFLSVLGSYKVGKKLTPAEKLHNQFVFNFGGVFNL